MHKADTVNTEYIYSNSTLTLGSPHEMASNFVSSMMLPLNIKLMFELGIE